MPVTPLLYSLEETCHVPWQNAAESQLHDSYPFLNQEDTDQNFVIRRYLETLWLPASFNPLPDLVTSLRRVCYPQQGSPSRPHPLHALLEPLLLSTRRAFEKYRTELVQILADGGGAGEQEEMMMWYAWEHEKAENEKSENFEEEKWRRTWLERLERRETMIQVLLHMLKLTLPGPKPTLKDEIKKEKKKRRKDSLPVETDEERLESFMDKIAVWQLTSSIDASQLASRANGPDSSEGKPDRHWTQAFYEDIIDPLFKSELPEQCALFRSKLNPESAFSDVEETETESLVNRRTSRAGARVPSVPSRFLTHAPPQDPPMRPTLHRSRSRSLSVSLAQDEVSQLASFVAPKRALSREVSMSLVFKEKPKVQAKFRIQQEEQKLESEKPKGRKDMGLTLIEATPTKPRRDASLTSDTLFACGWQERLQSHFLVPSPPQTSSSEPGDICIEDTPVVMRKRQMQNRHEAEELISSLSPLPDNASHRTVQPARKNARSNQGRKSRSSAASRPTRTKRRFAEKEIPDGTHDERNGDESYMDSFKPSNITLFKEDDVDMSKSSPSPATRMRTCGLVDVRSQPAELLDIEMSTPTKGGVRRK